MSNDEELNKFKINKRKNLYMVLQNIDNLFFSLNNVYHKLKEREDRKNISFFSQFIEKFCKNILFILTLLIICGGYYFYIYVK
jgi:hypothetical protein